MVTFLAGQKITAYGTRDLRNLTKNKEYTCLYGTEAGIFYNRPFVTVIDDDGEKFSCHQSRFELVTYSDGTTNAGN